MSSGDKLRKLLIHEEWVRRLAKHLVLDKDRAEDIVQQTWLEAMRRPPSHEKNLKSWLSAVARNAARKIARSEKARAARESKVSSKDFHTHEFPLSEPDAVGRMIADLVASTKEPYRSVLRLRFYEELSPAEIAARLKIPLHTVYSRLDRALERIESRLTARFGDRKTWQLALIPWIRWSGAGLGKSGVAKGVAAAAALVVALPATFLWLRPAQPVEAETAPIVVADPPSAPSEPVVTPAQEEWIAFVEEEFEEEEDLPVTEPESVFEELPSVQPSIPVSPSVETPPAPDKKPVPPPPAKKSGGFKTKDGNKGGGGNGLGTIKNPPKKTKTFSVSDNNSGKN